MMIFFMLFRLSTSLYVDFGLRPPSFLQRLRLPQARIWEYVWLFSLVPCIMGLLSLKKNLMSYMQQYLIGGLVFALAPTVYAINDLWEDFTSYWATKQTSILFLGYPMIVVWFMFLILGLQLHIYGTYCSFQLLRAWTISNEQALGKRVK